MSLDVFLIALRPTTVFEQNITHNLTEMAAAAGIYQHLWRPEELDITGAGQLIAPLHEGLRRLLSDPAKFRQYNPANGWGNYENLVEFVRLYHAACDANPDAKIEVCR